MKIGERIYNLERLFNVKAGLSRKDDTLPKRFLTEPLSEGLSKGRTVPLDSMLEDYYRLRDWDETGAPSKAKLEELGIRL
jgi:aldehyde:ferredoxin oxidoreductase